MTTGQLGQITMYRINNAISCYKRNISKYE